MGLKVQLAVLAALVVGAAVGLVLSSGAGSDSDDPIALLRKMIQDERSYVETLEATTEDEQSAVGFYLNHLSVFELGASVSTNLEWDLCQLGIPLERQALAEFRIEPRVADSPLWDRYSVLLNDLEVLLCREYDELTLVGDQYIGPLGDFRVNQGSVFDGKPCSRGIGEFGPFPFDFHQSELWLDVFSSRAQPDFCADDDTLSAIFEYTDRAIMKRGFFYQAPLAVSFNALREQPQLLEVEGHPAILGLEASPSEQVFLWAIERFPERDTPGIYVFVMAVDSDAELAREIAEELLP